MEVVYKTDWMEILKDEEKYYIRYDSGELVSRILKIEVSEEDAKKAQKSEEAAYRVILHYQNMAMFGEDYLERGKQKS